MVCVFRELNSLLATRALNTTQLQASRKAHVDGIKQLKSDLKKSTAFVKKLRVVTPDGIVGCIRDVEQFNLTLYISEIVTALLETHFKAADVPNIARLCSSLHRRYEEFTPPLISGLMESLMTPDGGDKEESKKKRVQLRFAIELFQEGIISVEESMMKLLRRITGRMKGAPPGQPIDLAGLTSFIKFGAEILFGYTNKKLRSLCAEAGKDIADCPLRQLTTTSMRNELRIIVSDVYSQLCADLVEAHKGLLNKKKRLEKDRVLHGTLSEAKQQELDGATRLFEKLLSAVTSISECSSQPLPALAVEEESIDANSGISVYEGASKSAADCAPFDDIETKSFYEDLPDLLTMVPLTALGLSPEQATALREQWERQDGKLDTEEDDSISEALLGSEESAEAMLAGDEDPQPKTEGASAEVVVAPEIEDTPQIRVAALINEKLPEVINKQRAVEFCVSFCYLNSKASRKKLVAALLKVNRNRVELLATYSRIIASLHRIFPLDIAPPILEELQRTFYGSFKAKTQFYLESKIKTVRFVSELVKFKVAPPITAFWMMKLLMSDLTRHNVELLTVMLETCGRFLYLLPATQERTNEVLKTLLRLRSVKNLDMHQQSMIEAAYFTVKPPERVARVAKQRSVLQQYIAHLLGARLDRAMEHPKDGVEAVIKSLRRLPWKEDPSVEREVVRTVLKMTRKKYVCIPLLADCISGLNVFRPNLLIRLIDTLLEVLHMLGCVCLSVIICLR